MDGVAESVRTQTPAAVDPTFHDGSKPLGVLKGIAVIEIGSVNHETGEGQTHGPATEIGFAHVATSRRRHPCHRLNHAGSFAIYQGLLVARFGRRGKL